MPSNADLGFLFMMAGSERLTSMELKVLGSMFHGDGPIEALGDWDFVNRESQKKLGMKLRGMGSHRNVDQGIAKKLMDWGWEMIQYSKLSREAQKATYLEIQESYRR